MKKKIWFPRSPQLFNNYEGNLLSWKIASQAIETIGLRSPIAEPEIKLEKKYIDKNRKQ